MFRGLLLDWLRNRLSNWTAIAVAAVLFAPMHSYPIAMQRMIRAFGVG